MDIHEELSKIASYYGLCHQLYKTKEELTELEMVIKGYIVGRDTEAHLIEEIADVEVMTAQLKLLLDSEKEVDKIKQFKVNRQLERIARGVER